MNNALICACYGCTIARQHAGIPEPDRFAEPCNPTGACEGNGQCWTHSVWIDEAACDPPHACETGTRCATHDEARS